MDRKYDPAWEIAGNNYRGKCGRKNHRGRPRYIYVYIYIQIYYIEYIQQIRDQGCDLYVQTKRKVDRREEWKLVANQSQDYNQGTKETI